MRRERFLDIYISKDIDRDMEVAVRQGSTEGEEGGNVDFLNNPNRGIIRIIGIGIRVLKKEVRQDWALASVASVKSYKDWEDEKQYQQE